MSAVVLTGALVLAGCSGSAVEVDIPDTLVEPGTALELGETVRVIGQAYVERDGQNDLEDTELGFTVVSVEEQDPSVFDSLDNAEDFAGYTPVTIAYQVDLPEDSEAENPSVSGPYGVLASGEPSQYLDMEGWANNDVLTKMCWDAAAFDGTRTRQSCTVLLVPEGDELAQILWDGEAHTQMSIGGDGPYVENPLVLPLPSAD